MEAVKTILSMFGKEGNEKEMKIPDNKEKRLLILTSMMPPVCIDGICVSSTCRLVFVGVDMINRIVSTTQKKDTGYY